LVTVQRSLNSFIKSPSLGEVSNIFYPAPRAGYNIFGAGCGLCIPVLDDEDLKWTLWYGHVLFPNWKYGLGRRA